LLAYTNPSYVTTNRRVSVNCDDMKVPREKRYTGFCFEFDGSEHEEKCIQWVEGLCLKYEGLIEYCCLLKQTKENPEILNCYVQLKTNHDGMSLSALLKKN
jgi:hypothetical protein